ncbi:hypothetical protein R3W88_026669 [Solanum pinnatisectum]|uniref:Uncharacterized protein n=1 Tax=Solanum pinnatisectum TaxID=50273 RepID=A0AAV9LHB3_9SOLN|nr:hypothetical protein R3W88_026669 [Solanum pinnatisectum]
MGRIWILWNPRVVEFQLMGTHRQVIHHSIKVKGSDMIFDLSMVYGLPTCLDRRDLWYELNQYNMRDFKHCLLDTRLPKLKTVDRNYTWTNGHTYNSIYKSLVNAMWLQAWTHLECSILNPSFLDHSPLCLIIAA